jgi:hypothetical protein
MYNRRPENIHGDLVRFIVLDQGFKEGIDLFDVKYVHLMEPLTIPADQKQAIGRGTRFCGQRGLTFHPTFGWPLYVFKYDVVMNDRAPHPNGAPFTLHDLYLQYANLDMRKIAFAAEVEDATIEGAVDYDLTTAIHGFSIPPPSPILKRVATAASGGAGSAGTASEMDESILPPAKVLNHRAMKTYIQSMFAKKFSYEKIKLQNNCSGGAVGGATGGAKAKPTGVKKLPPGTIVQFTPTQDFVRHYFTPASPYKGMLLWHSVGTGKTCTAIATASSTFEPEGYTILWVTRHTLKSDIFKNLFRQVCSLVVQRKLLAGEMTLPASKKQLSERWIEPISYKQFTNLLTKKNKYYEMMVKRNGNEDPLRKTLLIIDEAHKLYSPGVAASEKPNTDILEEMIQNSYRVSGDESVRMLVMTATPYTEDGMEMVKLLNLLRPAKDHFPVDFDDYAGRYLNASGAFTSSGREKWLNAISGYVSYLNRSKDARNFAYPVLENVYVPISGPMEDEEARALPEDGIAARMKELKPAFKEAKAAMRMAKREAKSDLKESIAECIEKVKAEMAEAKAMFEAAKVYCKETYAKAPAEKKECMAEQKAAFDKQEAELKDKKRKCKEEPDNEDYRETLADIEKQFNEAAGEFMKYKEAYDVLQAPRKENTAAMRELRPELKELRDAFKRSYNRLKLIRKDAKRIKNIMERKKRYEAIRRNEAVAAAAVRAEYIKVKEEMTRRINENRVLRIRQGATTVGNITQAKTLDKKCLKD